MKWLKKRGMNKFYKVHSLCRVFLSNVKVHQSRETKMCHDSQTGERDHLICFFSEFFARNATG